MLACALLLATASLSSQDSGATAPPAPSAAAAEQPVLSEDTLVLYGVQLDSLTLSDALAAYGDPADPYLPVGELARLLDLDVDVSPALSRVTGRIGQAARPLLVDLGTGTARLGGNAVPMSGTDAIAGAGDIYIKASALGQILPIDLQIDPEALSIVIVAREVLPIQGRMERLARLRSLNGQPEAPDAVTRMASPYELLTPPAFDFTFEAGSNSRGQSFSRRYDARMAGDLLFMNYQGYLGSDDRGRPTEARLLLERRSRTGGLLGPLDATRVSLGDVFTPALALGPRSVAGRGFSFSTAPLDQVSVFETIDLRGELPIGYDVELYLNDVLRSGQRSPAQGRYEFLDVPLVRGINVLRLVSYGPRGERAEQIRIVNVGGGQVEPGRTTVDLGIVQQERPLFSLNRTDPLFAGAGAGDLRVVAGVAHGLTTNMTVVVGAALYPSLAGDARQMLTFGLRTSLLGLAVHADMAGDQKGGRALSLGVAGQPLGVSTVVQHVEYRGGFADENQIFGNPEDVLARHTELTLDFSLPEIGGKVIPLSFRALRDGFANGGSNWIAGARASTTLGETLVSTGFDYQRRAVPGLRTIEQLGGTLAVSRFLDYKWQLRGVLDYQLLPTSQLRAVTFTADRSISDQLAIRLGAAHTFESPRTTSIQAGATLRLPFGDVAITGDYSVPQNDWGVGIRIAFGFGYDQGTRRYRMTPFGAAAGGSLALNAFVDRNGNGAFDDGEEAVPGVTVEGGERPGTTDGRGRAFVTGLGTAPVARLQIGTNRIENMYVSAPPGAVEFSPRPGKTIMIDYPLTPTTEVLTRVLFTRGEGAVGLSAVRLLLVRDGREPRVSTTEFDGTAVFSDVPPGTYRLALDPEQAGRLRMRLKEPVEIQVLADGNPTPDATAEVLFAPAGDGDPE